MLRSVLGLLAFYMFAQSLANGILESRNFDASPPQRPAVVESQKTTLYKSRIGSVSEEQSRKEAVIRHKQDLLTLQQDLRSGALRRTRP
ncbi:MAG: hypothetical protein MOGMAGMI_02172 [Candidatus Omnitrophica bacterium]|nr:hypothetical protein [Candidatus Omnitrophota bacterium]